MFLNRKFISNTKYKISDLLVYNLSSFQLPSCMHDAISDANIIDKYNCFTQYI